VKEAVIPTVHSEDEYKIKKAPTTATKKKTAAKKKRKQARAARKRH